MNLHRTFSWITMFSFWLFILNEKAQSPNSNVKRKEKSSSSTILAAKPRRKIKNEETQNRETRKRDNHAAACVTRRLESKGKSRNPKSKRWNEFIFFWEREVTKLFWKEGMGVFLHQETGVELYIQNQMQSLFFTLRSARISQDDEMTLEKFVSAHVKF